MFRRPQLLLVAALLVLSSVVFADLDPALLAGLEARSIGPAGMSGRLASIEAVESDPNIIYVGAATGGVWKSVDGGLKWEPIFDDQPVAATGAVAIFQLNPDIVWVGTGEGSPRNSVSGGNGIYKSLDGGKTWTHLGLDKTERIHRIRLHPTNPDIAYVAALGQMWGENPERGVFKTTNGGKSWDKVLYVDEKTGAADLVMDPSNPQKLFAAMWQYRRWPWFFDSGGPSSGLYVTHDGGQSWKRFTEEDGLPKGNLGRIGVDVCREFPQIVYALVEAEESAMLRSTDGGRTWQTMNSEPTVANRPFYYADIRCDPKWPNRVYDLASRVKVSDDSGRTFEILGESNSIHPDYQAMWINPAEPNHLLIGNDGGMGVSRDRGETWRFVANLPLAQYYHIAVDMETPYNVYGGMQDNGSWRGPSRVQVGQSFWGSRRGISNWHWVNVGGGDGFDTRADPEDANRGYSMSQGGYLQRWDLVTGEGKSIRPPQPGDEELRFNWNAALALDPFVPGTIYYGSQFVHKSTDRGDTWTVISDDLTTNNPEWQKQADSGGLTPDVTGAENFTTIVALAPSPVQEGVLWAGTDDGRLHVTQDGGQNWTSLEERISGVPANTWIPHIEPSTYDAAEAFVIFDDHRRSNWTPYVFHTKDFGQSWRNLATDDIWGYALSIDQDPVDPSLLFLGTEFGLYASTDAGSSWFKWTHGVPTVSVMDLVIHPREHDLVMGTHGRAAFIIDDISPLRTIAEVSSEEMHLFPIKPARQYESEQRREGYSLGSANFQGENRPYGALIDLWIDDDTLPHPDDEIERERKETKRREELAASEKEASEEKASEEPGEEAGESEADENGKDEKKEGQLKIEIANGEGETMRKFDHEAHQGLNRIVWDLRRDPFKRPETGGFSFGGRSGPQLPPGTYTVTVKHGEQEASGEVEILPDVHIDNSAADWAAREAYIERLDVLYEALTDAVKRVDRTKSDLRTVVALAEKEKPDDDDADNPHQELIDEANKVIKTLDEKANVIRRPENIKGIVRRSEVMTDLGYAYGAGLGYWTPPTPTDLAYLERAERRLRESMDDLNQYYSEAITPLRSKFRESVLTLLPEGEPLAIPQKESR